MSYDERVQPRHIIPVDHGGVMEIAPSEAFGLFGQVLSDQRDLLSVVSVGNYRLQAAFVELLEDVRRRAKIEGHHLCPSRGDLGLTLPGLGTAAYCRGRDGE